MYEIEENQGPTYWLDGKALEIARELHNYSKEVQKEYKQVARQIADFSHALLINFD